MKRAEVHADRWCGSGGFTGTWSVYLFPLDHPREADVPIPDRDPDPAIYREGEPFPTHAEALHAALAAVGLAKPVEHREAP